jgi:hypothetical protein
MMCLGQDKSVNPFVACYLWCGEVFKDLTETRLDYGFLPNRRTIVFRVSKRTAGGRERERERET